MKLHRLVALSWLLWGGVYQAESWGTHDPNKKQDEPPVNEQAPENLPSEEEEFYRELVKQPQEAEAVEQLINEKDTDTLLQLKETLENQEEEKGSLTEPQAQALARINGALNQRELEKVAGRSGIEGDKRVPTYKRENGIIRANFENGKPTQKVLTGKLDGNSYKSETLPSDLVVSSDGRIFKDAPTAPPRSRSVQPSQPSPAVPPESPSPNPSSPIPNKTEIPKDQSIPATQTSPQPDGTLTPENLQKLAGGEEAYLRIPENPSKEIQKSLKEAGLSYVNPGEIVKLDLRGDKALDVLNRTGLSASLGDLVVAGPEGKALFDQQNSSLAGPGKNTELRKKEYEQLLTARVGEKGFVPSGTGDSKALLKDYKEIIRNEMVPEALQEARASNGGKPLSPREATGVILGVTQELVKDFTTPLPENPNENDVNQMSKWDRILARRQMEGLLGTSPENLPFVMGKELAPAIVSQPVQEVIEPYARLLNALRQPSGFLRSK